MKYKSHQSTDQAKDDSLKQKAVKIFKAMGYEVEYDRCFPGGKIEVFIKEKKIIGDEYTSWICSFDKDNRKVRKEDVFGLYRDWQIVKQELARKSNLYNDCQAMFISANGFTKGAIAASRKYRILLKTLDGLHNDKEEFIKTQEKLSRDFDDLLRASVDIDRQEALPLLDLCMAHLISWRLLRNIVENHKEWESFEDGSYEKIAMNIIKRIGKQKWE
jgi:hypothetical protein